MSMKIHKTRTGSLWAARFSSPYPHHILCLPIGVGGHACKPIVHMLLSLLSLEPAHAIQQHHRILPCDVVVQMQVPCVVAAQQTV